MTDTIVPGKLLLLQRARRKGCPHTGSSLPCPYLSCWIAKLLCKTQICNLVAEWGSFFLLRSKILVSSVRTDRPLRSNAFTLRPTSSEIIYRTLGGEQDVVPCFSVVRTKIEWPMWTATYSYLLRPSRFSVRRLTASVTRGFQSKSARDTFHSHESCFIDEFYFWKKINKCVLQAVSVFRDAANHCSKNMNMFYALVAFILSV